VGSEIKAVRIGAGQPHRRLRARRNAASVAAQHTYLAPWRQAGTCASSGRTRPRKLLPRGRIWRAPGQRGSGTEGSHPGAAEIYFLRGRAKLEWATTKNKKALTSEKLSASATPSAWNASYAGAIGRITVQTESSKFKAGYLGPGFGQQTPELEPGILRSERFSTGEKLGSQSR